MTRTGLLYDFFLFAKEVSFICTMAGHSEEAKVLLDIVERLVFLSKSIPCRCGRPNNMVTVTTTPERGLTEIRLYCDQH